MANTGGAVAAIQALFPDFSYLRTFDSLHFNRCGNCSTGDIFCSTLNLPQIPPKWIYFENKKKKKKRGNNGKKSHFLVVQGSCFHQVSGKPGLMWVLINQPGLFFLSWKSLVREHWVRAVACSPIRKQTLFFNPPTKCLNKVNALV